MKKFLLVLSILLIELVGYGQSSRFPGVQLGNSYQDVYKIYSCHRKHFTILVQNDSILTYAGKDGAITSYTFSDYGMERYCTECSILLDMMAGEELIGIHHNDWIYVNDTQWLYETKCYGSVLVTLKYFQDKMLFIYNYEK